MTDDDKDDREEFHHPFPDIDKIVFGAWSYDFAIQCPMCGFETGGTSWLDSSDDDALHDSMRQVHSQLIQAHDENDPECPHGIDTRLICTPPALIDKFTPGSNN